MKRTMHISYTCLEAIRLAHLCGALIQRFLKEAKNQKVVFSFVSHFQKKKMNKIKGQLISKANLEVFI